MPELPKTILTQQGSQVQKDLNLVESLINNAVEGAAEPVAAQDNFTIQEDNGHFNAYFGFNTNWCAPAGHKVEGVEFTIDGSSVTAGANAEVFNSNTNINTGTNAHVEGIGNINIGQRSHIEGTANTCKVNDCHIEGTGNSVEYSNTSNRDTVTIHIDGKDNEIYVGTMPNTINCSGLNNTIKEYSGYYLSVSGQSNTLGSTTGTAQRYFNVANVSGISNTVTGKATIMYVNGTSNNVDITTAGFVYVVGNINNIQKVNDNFIVLGENIKFNNNVNDSTNTQGSMIIGRNHIINYEGTQFRNSFLGGDSTTITTSSPTDECIIFGTNTLKSFSATKCLILGGNEVNNNLNDTGFQLNEVLILGDNDLYKTGGQVTNSAIIGANTIQADGVDMLIVGENTMMQQSNANCTGCLVVGTNLAVAGNYNLVHGIGTGAPIQGNHNVILGGGHSFTGDPSNHDYNFVFGNGNTNRGQVNNSITMGTGLQNLGDNDCVIFGKYNISEMTAPYKNGQPNPDYVPCALVIGNGTSADKNDQSNLLTLTKTGELTVAKLIGDVAYTNPVDSNITTVAAALDYIIQHL